MKFSGVKPSRAIPTENVRNAPISNFPFNLSAASSDFKVLLAKINPVIKNVPKTARK
jgi:hypothetical protein